MGVVQRNGIQKQMRFVKSQIEQAFPEETFADWPKPSNLEPSLLWAEELHLMIQLLDTDFSQKLAANPIQKG